MPKMADTEDLQEFFSRVYDVLVEQAGASRDEDERFSFVFEFTGQKPTGAYRFCGSLGMGGKFYFPAFNVGCYPEDRTSEREAAILATNQSLRSFGAEYRALTLTN
jgi:hypothetical protein